MFLVHRAVKGLLLVLHMCCVHNISVVQLPLLSGTYLPSLSWLSSKAGDDPKDASTTVDRATAIQNAYKHCFGGNISSHRAKYFATRVGSKHPINFFIEKWSAWIAAFGKEAAEDILRSRPMLLTQDPFTCTTRLANACDLYGWSQEEGLAALQRHGHVITSTIEHQANWRAEVMNLLELTETDVRHLVLKFPALLGHSPSNLAVKMRFLRTAFSDATPDVKSVVYTSPTVLGLKPSSVAAKISIMQDELGLFVSYDPRKIFIARPSLLTRSPITLKQKLHAITFSCQNNKIWMQELQLSSHVSLARVLICTDEAFARLRFYQTQPKKGEYGFMALLIMSQNKFHRIYPGFTEWWVLEREAGPGSNGNTFEE